MPARASKCYVEDPDIRKMRVRTWFHAVIQASGLSTRQLEKMFGEGDGTGAPRSCIWNKYRRGEVVPRSCRQGDGRPKLVERVEARYPGTAKWLFSPIWRLADKAPMEMREIRQVYEGLSPAMRSHFILPPSQASKIFWRYPLDPDELCEKLENCTTFEVLVAILALMREAEITQNPGNYIYWIEVSPYLLQNIDWDGLKTLATFRELSDYVVRVRTTRARPGGS